MGKARTFGVGMDYSPTSKAALRWAAENLIDEGDRVILIQAQPPKADHTRKQLFEENGSRKYFSRFHHYFLPWRFRIMHSTGIHSYFIFIIYEANVFFLSGDDELSFSATWGIQGD